MAGAYDKCAVCAVPMNHPPGRGKARKYCGQACQAKADAERLSGRPIDRCRIAQCEKSATRRRLKLCEMHYIRQYRNGTTEYVGNALPGNLMHSAGYVLQAAPDHPRALGGYRAYQHRVVFTDAHGEGPFDCHWCSKRVTWQDMHVDHVDADRGNNDLANLVASCPPCNERRGHERMMQTLRDRRGVTVRGRTQTLNEWAAEVGIARTSIIRRLKAGWSAEDAVMKPRGKSGPKAKGAGRSIGQIGLFSTAAMHQ